MPNRSYPVPVYGQKHGWIRAEDGATDGATIGDNVLNSDGTIFVPSTGTVTSVAVANATGITWTGSPITTSGTFTPTLSANLQAWHGLATSTKVNTAGDTMTGQLKLPNSSAGGLIIQRQGGTDGARLWKDTGATDIVYLDNLNAMGIYFRTSSTTDRLRIFDSGIVQVMTGPFVVDNNTNGYVTAQAGTATGNPGFIEFFTSDDVRRGFIGHNSSSRLIMAAENTWGWSITGNVDMTGGTVTYGALEIGYRDIPRVTGGIERGKMFATAAGFTINTGSAAGSTYSVYNNSAAAITLTQGAGLTLRLAGTATTGNRTLAIRGFATIWFNSTTEAIVSGNVT